MLQLNRPEALLHFSGKLLVLSLTHAQGVASDHNTNGAITIATGEFIFGSPMAHRIATSRVHFQGHMSSHKVTRYHMTPSPHQVDAPPAAGLG